MDEIDLSIQTKFTLLHSHVCFLTKIQKGHIGEMTAFLTTTKKMLVKSDSQKQKNLITRMK